MLHFHMFSQPPLQVLLCGFARTPLAAFAVALMGCATNLRADSIALPNYSFELPATTSYDIDIASWQQVGTFQTGVFMNTSNGSPDHYDNCDGNQAAFIVAATGAGFFQDYNSVDYAHPNPPHDFNVLFEAGKSYDLTVALAVSYNQPTTVGSTLQIGLYYRDASSNMVV